MDEDTIDELFERLDELQEESGENKREEEGDGGMNRQAAYYLGEQTGIGKAKYVVRQALNEVEG